MTKNLLLLLSMISFLSLAFANIGDGPCSRTDTSLIKNVGTNMYLSLHRRTLTLSHIEQIWCMDDESAPTWQVFRGSSTSRDMVRFYCGNSNFVMEVQEGNLDDAVIGLVDQAANVGNAAYWQIIPLLNSNSVSILTTLSSSELLALSAVSSQPAEGVTLRPYDSADPLQTWVFIDKDY